MSILNAIILGLVQGLTEFIPVSSSGHLAIFSKLLGIDGVFVFDVLLNIGTLLALIIFYRKRIFLIVKRIVIDRQFLLLLKLIAATIPAVFIGILLNDQIEVLNGMLWVVIIMLVAVGVPMILYGSANSDADDRDINESVDWKIAIKIGVAQMLALIPGVSRSGITILTGIRSNLSAEKAAEFSFLMAIPIIAGASAKTLLSQEGLSFLSNNLGAVLIGNLVSFIAGFFAVGFLLKFISNHGLKGFGWYRIGLAVALTVLMLTKLI